MTIKRKVAVPLSLGALVAALALPVAASGAGTARDIVSGSSKLTVATPFGPLPGHLQVNGSSDPNGANPRGHFFGKIDATSLGLGVVEFEGNIICMFTVGNTNNNNGIVTASNSLLVPVGSGTRGRVVDNGSPGAGVDETAGVAGLPPSTSCSSFPVATVPITSGNYVVQDAP